MGKTRLAEEAASVAVATGGRVLVGRCYTAERSLFLQPFVDVLTQVLGELSADDVRALAGGRGAALAALLPGLADDLGGPEQGRGSPEAERRRAFEAVLQVLIGLAAQRPLLLVLDDLHNTGQASIELVHYVARHAGPARLLVVATVRAEEGADALGALAEVARRCDVGPLPPAAVAELEPTLAAGAGRRDPPGPVATRCRGGDARRPRRRANRDAGDAAGGGAWRGSPGPARAGGAAAGRCRARAVRLPGRRRAAGVPARGRPAL
jgi:hypothetical protein